MRIVKIKFDTPVYVGQVILDQGKTLMYNFHYDVISDCVEYLTPWIHNFLKDNNLINEGYSRCLRFFSPLS